MSAPKTDLDEVRKALNEVSGAIGALGKLLMNPTKGDTSIHPEVRGVFVGLADAMAGTVEHLHENLRCNGIDHSVFDVKE